jgi:hypothetical protein
MSMDQYHSQCCDGPSISSSGLRTIELQSPHQFWSFSDLNPDRFESEETHALDFGRAAHSLLLGDEVFSEHYSIRPDEFDSWRTKAAKEWRAAEQDLGKTVLEPSDIDHIAGMAKSLKAHGLPDVVFDGEAEVSLVWKDVTGVWIKSRPDALPKSGDQADLKTTADASLFACMRDITKRGYFMQMALGAEGMQRVLGRRPAGNILIFVQKKPPYTVSAIPLSEDAMYWGAMMNRRAIDTFARCLDEGNWPGDTDHMPEYNLPSWMTDRLSDEQAEGALPNTGDGE